ncbi:MAG: dTMP kinase [Treponema sp.]|jgi:dTMP kinase|nr:dTMP kinase [Treponema sp.]
MVLENFIVFEGIDGAGTTTQKEILAQRPETAGFLFSSEPTGKTTGIFLRQVLKGSVKLDPGTIAYLFAADRNEHLYGTGGILQALRAGRTVVSDRYLFSSLAYQSQDCGRELPQRLNGKFPLPELLFYFDIQPDLALQRITGRKTKEIYETADYLSRITASYKEILEAYQSDEKGTGMKIIFLDAARSKEEIAQIIWRELQKLPILKK